MKFVYSILVVIWFTSIFNNSYAQKNPGEYIIKDSTYSMGKVVPLSKGRIQFQKTKKEVPEIYTALEIKEYGYDRKVYESLLINENQKFVNRIVSGKVNLYRDKKLYGLKIDNNLTLFNKEDYRVVLGESITCKGSDGSLSKLTYSKTALINYINAYNAGQCNMDNFPYKKLGGYVGFNFLQFTAVFENSLELKDETGVPTIGFFYDMPLFRPRSLFLTTELNWLYGKPLFYNENQSNTSYSGLTINGVNSLISTKWILNQKKIKTYLKAGALVSLVSITSPTGLIETKSYGSVIDVSQQEISQSNTVLYGFNSGIGLEIPYKKRKNFHIEFKYVKAFNGNSDSVIMNFSGCSLLAGFNI